MHSRKDVNGKNRLNEAQSSVAAGSSSKTRVMVVDDHKMLRETLKASLIGLGYDVVAEAKDGADAVETAAGVRPDVILMDISMPNLDGIAACASIKEQFSSVHIIILTMHNDQAILSDAIRAGANGYLVKDCSLGEIKSAIDSVVSGETALSPHLAASVLAEVRDGKATKQEKVITAREEEVLQLIADGCSTPEVAEQLFISQKTVKNHLASIYQKLDARDRTQAVLAAVRMGIVSLN